MPYIVALVAQLFLEMPHIVALVAQLVLLSFQLEIEGEISYWLSGHSIVFSQADWSINRSLERSRKRVVGRERPMTGSLGQGW